MEFIPPPPDHPPSERGSPTHSASNLRNPYAMRNIHSQVRIFSMDTTCVPLLCNFFLCLFNNLLLSGTNTLMESCHEEQIFQWNDSLELSYLKATTSFILDYFPSSFYSGVILLWLYTEILELFLFHY